MLVMWVAGRATIRGLAAGISPQSPGFRPRQVYVRFVEEKVSMRQIFFGVLRFSLSV
jgi:hypothetical protein